MYGLKLTDIDALRPLLKAEITQICIGTAVIQFNFYPSGNISVQGRCELIGSAGEIVDVWEENTRSGVFRFPELLMTPVSDVVIDSPKSFMMSFANGLALRVIDNSEHYESFSVGNLYV